MWFPPREVEYKVTGLIDMNTNTLKLVTLELELLAAKYNLKIAAINETDQP